MYNAKCNYNNENLQDLDTRHIDQEDSGLKTDEPEVRDEINTPTFEYEIAYYTNDNALIYQFKMKEPIKKNRRNRTEERNERKRKERNEKQEDEQNEPLDLSLKSSSILNATPIST